MKKLALTIAIVLGMSIGAFAQGGLLGYGFVGEQNGWNNSWSTYNWNRGALNMPSLPTTFGETNDQPAAPLGSGALLLIGFGAAYAMKKRSKK